MSVASATPVRQRITAIISIAALALTLFPTALFAGQREMPLRRYVVHEGVTHGNLTIYPITSAEQFDSRLFLTLDDGLRTGEVEVTEGAGVRPMVRQRPGDRMQMAPTNRGSGAEVNRLMLLNRSNRPLVLLAGEVVTGGKQDRVVAKDMIVPSQSDPVDLNVFCVEPGRWTERAGTNSGFSGGASFHVGNSDVSVNVDRGASNAYQVGIMVQPSVRSKAMVEKDQSQVWDQVGKANEANKQLASSAPAAVAGNATVELNGTSSYAQVQENKAVQYGMHKRVQDIETVKTPKGDTVSLTAQLRAMNAVGVVVAVNGQVIWADIFADNAMLLKYWPKLELSYASESITTRGQKTFSYVPAAQHFVDTLEGNHEVVDNSPGVYRHTEVSGNGYKVFALTALLPKTGYDVHISKVETR